MVVAGERGSVMGEMCRRREVSGVFWEVDRVRGPVVRAIRWSLTSWWTMQEGMMRWRSFLGGSSVLGGVDIVVVVLMGYEVDGTRFC